MTARRFTWAHILMPLLMAAAIFSAFEVGYPNVSTLFGIYMVVALTLYQFFSRISQAPPRRRFGGASALYALLIGFLAFYFASDAYVLERAYQAYPAPFTGFLGFGSAILVLVILNQLRGSRADDIYVTEPHFVTIGVILFIATITVQIVVMTALVDWIYQAAAYRIIFIAASLWTARLGVYEHRPGMMVIGAFFAIVGIMTAYLDLLWDYRTTTIFLAGAVGLCAALILIAIIWSQRVRHA